MNKHIQILHLIAGKPTRRIIGLMSGTSLDGLDVALCEVSGSGEHTQLQVLQFKTVDYADDVKDEIRTVFAKKTIDFQHLVLLNAWIGGLHADMLLSCLADWGIDAKSVDLIASHGQTVMHAPKALHGVARFGNATLQIGDGDHIAVKTGIITLSDFRQKHVAAGGEGAPLAVYGDYFLFGKPGQNRIMLNMGGIANFTFLPGSMDPTQVFVTDTGPGNTLLDAYTRTHFAPLAFDRDSALARQGCAHAGLLAALKSDAFFDHSFPKTTGPELFNLDFLQRAQAASATLALSAHDVLATLTLFSAETIARAIGDCLERAGLRADQTCVYCSGGGAHNPLLMASIRERLSAAFEKTDILGIAGDAKEAVLFAVLANESVAGGESDFGTRRGIPSVSMGKISLPG